MNSFGPKSCFKHVHVYAQCSDGTNQQDGNNSLGDWVFNGSVVHLLLFAPNIGYCMVTHLRQKIFLLAWNGIVEKLLVNLVLD